MVLPINTPSISAFFPAYNDVASIGKILHTMAWLLPKLTDDFEIVIVDDGSNDGTGPLLDSLTQEYEFSRVIHHGINRGYGAALITGFANCTKDLVFYTDGDGQYDVEELPKLLAAMTQDIDIVNGYKISRSDPKYRIVLGRVYQFLMRILFRLNVKDVDCDFRLFRRALFARVQLTYDSGVICVEMMKKFQAIGCRMVELPVHHYHRSHGRSQFFCFKHLRKIGSQLICAWWTLVVRGKLTRHPLGALAINEEPSSSLVDFTFPRLPDSDR
jgi:glycosyltransferase involved in cell wall biosynthesis